MSDHTAEVYEDSAGEWRYRLKARNGEIVATSEAYTRKSSAKRAVRRNHPDVTVIHFFDASGDYDQTIQLPKEGA